MSKRIESDHVLNGTWMIQFNNLTGSGELVEINILQSGRNNSFLLQLIVNGHIDAEYLVKLPNYDAGNEIQL